MWRKWTIVAVLLGVVLVLATAMEDAWPGPVGPSRAAAGTQPGATVAPPLRIGITPERDIFAQRHRYQALAGYLAGRLNRPVKLVTAASYQVVLDDLENRRVDVAFLGSLVAAMSIDRSQARVLLKTQLPGHRSDYHGVIFVREDSPMRGVDDLVGRSIAMVRTTTGGHLFPVFELSRAGMLGRPGTPRTIWVGTHDDAYGEVAAGRADAGAAKDLRLDELEAQPGAVKMRRLAVSESVPENGLVVRADLAHELSPRLAQILAGMADDAAGRKALEAFGCERFVPCTAADYAAVYDMVEALGEGWQQMGIPGQAPKKPKKD